MSVFDLWLPVILSGLATHILSTLAWTVLPHHKPEWTQAPNEDQFINYLEENRFAPGQYIFPIASSSEVVKSPEYQQKLKTRCGTLIIWSKPPNMGLAIGLTLVSFMIMSFVIGYLASIALPAGSSFVKVLQFVTTAGLLAHVAAKFPNVFWFRRKIAMDVLDGVCFAFATGLIFAALWPKA